MKLLKKLLPIATLASVATIVPSVTSCSSALASTSDFKYEPKAKHTSDSIKSTDTAKIKAIKEDYFSIKDRFVQDVIYAKAQNYAKAKEELEKAYPGSTYTFSAKMTSFNIKGTKTLTVKVGETTKEVLGYIIDYETEYSRNYSITIKDKTFEEVKYKQIKYTSQAHETDIVKNGFAYLWVNDDNKLTIRCALLDEASDQWVWEDHECGTATTEWTYTNDRTDVDTAHLEGNAYYSKETGLATDERTWDMYCETQYVLTPMEAIEVTTNTGSYYLKDITFSE